MTDDELLAAAVAVKMALGKTEDPADAVKAGTIRKMVKRLNPGLNHGETGEVKSRRRRGEDVLVLAV